MSRRRECVTEEGNIRSSFDGSSEWAALNVDPINQDRCRVEAGDCDVVAHPVASVSVRYWYQDNLWCVFHCHGDVNS